MGLLDGGLAAVFSSALSSIYLDAQLYRSGIVFGNDGGGTDGFADPEPVKAQVDSATQAMRQAENYVDGDVRILVLASGVAQITTDEEIAVLGKRYSIQSVAIDPAQAAYDLRGRVA